MLWFTGHLTAIRLHDLPAGIPRFRRWVCDLIRDNAGSLEQLTIGDWRSDFAPSRESQPKVELNALLIKAANACSKLKSFTSRGSSPTRMITWWRPVKAW